MEIVDKRYETEEVMGLMEPLISEWFNERFTDLTEPQAMAIPVIHKRKNVLVSSPTGSGKTLTAFTSIINELTKYASEGKLEERIYCIYISPLKALANDVNRNLNTPLAEMREVAAAKGFNVPEIKVAVRSGDTPQNERQKMVRHPPHILITTPESLALILAAPKFREHLKNVEWLILDEIHDICDSKRGVFLSLTVERLRQYCNNEFTRIGLSATLAPIEAIASFLVGCNPDGSARDVTLIESASKKQLDLKVLCPTDDLTAMSTDMSNQKMYDSLKELIDTHDTTLVFTNTRSGAESVVYKLKERGIENIEVHHSSLGKDVRLDVEERLKKGEIKCVVSSTSLELGIDIGSVDLVCQIGSPKSVAKGLQRIGRSGHSFGKVAKGRLMVFDPDDLVECAVMCRAAHRGDIDRVGIPENCLDVLSQTVVGMSLDNRWDVDEAYALVKGSYCYRNLSRDSFIDVLKYLGSKDEHEGVYSKIWYDEETNQFGKKKGSKLIYFMNLGTIPEESNYRVITGHGSVAGELSEKFVERLSPRDVFVLGGRSFEFVRSKGMTAYVKEAGGRKPTVPSWAGEMLPRSFDLSMDVAVFRKELSDMLDMDTDELIVKIGREFDIDEGSARSLISYFREQKAVSGFVPGADRLGIEEYVDSSNNQMVIFHYPFGRRVNDALSRAYAYKISNTIGSNVSVTVSDDNFMIGTSHRIDIKDIPYMLKVNELESILRKAIKDSELFKLRFRHTAARSFMILRNYMGRPVSVNRQQVRSAYLLEALRDMDNVPVMEETYREVLEDDMDIKNAKVVLEMTENGKMGVQIMPFTDAPSPFAHNVILSGTSDIVMMEDKSAFLRDLHRKVLFRAFGDDLKEYEFEDDQVIPYFLQKIGRISCKEDIPKILERVGPLQAIREKGRNIYTYSDADKKTVDGWVRELIQEGTIGTVFLDEPHIMVSQMLPIYAAALKKDRELTDTDRKVYDCIEDNTALSDITAKLEISEDVTYRSVRKLESMYMVTRTGISGNNRWYFSREDYPEADRRAALDEVVLRHLNCFAPATVQEVAFALSVTDEEARESLESLVNCEEVSKGMFLISENVQYMRSIDHMRLKAGKGNVYDYESVENYRLTKGGSFETIDDYFEFYMSAGSEIDVFNRVPDFDLRDWYAMRDSGRIILGRFVRGKVRYVLSEDGDRLAYLRQNEINEEDAKLLNMIAGMGAASQRELVAATGREKDDIKESLMRLDRSLRVIRSFEEREDWGTENVYEVYRPDIPAEDPTVDLVRDCIKSHGPVPPMAIPFLLGVSLDNVDILAREAGADVILVGGGQTPMYIMPDEIPLLDQSHSVPEKMVIRSLYDPDLGPKWAEIASRYGDRWIYPVTLGNRIVGALELWEMSGCVEIRSMDLDSPDMLSDVLDALDNLMRFFNMKGIDVVRIRDILGKDSESIDDAERDLLLSKGYHFVNGFYAKGRITLKTFTEDQILAYVFHNQKVSKLSRYSTVDRAVQARGYIRNDQELVTHVMEKTSMKKQMDRGRLVKMTLSPPFVGYTFREFAPLYRMSKEGEVDDDMILLANLIKDRQPVSRKEILANSALSANKTLEALSNLSRLSMIYQDSDMFFSMVPSMNISYEDALKDVFRRHFREFGIFAAEQMSQFSGVKMRDTRFILSELEDEGLLVKGFFLEGDPTLRWMLAKDLDTPIKPFRDVFLLNTQDNLHFYLRPYIKDRCGSSECVVFSGTEIIASFKGKVCSTGAKVEDFKGSDKALRYIRELAKTLGVKIEDEKSEEDEDWDVSEFYLKTNPGA